MKKKISGSCNITSVYNNHTQSQPPPTHAHTQTFTFQKSKYKIGYIAASTQTKRKKVQDCIRIIIFVCWFRNWIIILS